MDLDLAVCFQDLLNAIDTNREYAPLTYHVSPKERKQLKEYIHEAKLERKRELKRAYRKSCYIEKMRRHKIKRTYKESKDARDAILKRQITEFKRAGIFRQKDVTLTEFLQWQEAFVLNRFNRDDLKYLLHTSPSRRQRGVGIWYVEMEYNPRISVDK